jgi:PucR C-terminal helix-turn-helix domain
LRDRELVARATGSAKEASHDPPIAPSGQDDEAEAAFELLADLLEPRLEQLAEAGIRAIRACMPAWLASSGPGWDLLEEHLRASLRAELDAFRAGSFPGGLPAADAALVDVAGEMGDLDALMAGYRFAQTSLWGAWFDLVGGAATSSQTKEQLLARGSRFFMRYADLVARFAAEAYRRAERNGPVLRIAGGSLGPLGEGDPFADVPPDFDFACYHLAAILWGGPPEATVEEMAARLDRVARFRARGATWWISLSGHEAVSQRKLRALTEFEPPPGVRLAIGLEGFGEQGLRRGFRQALRARALAGREAAVTYYADVAVESLALHREDEVRAFVAHELNGIDDDSAAAARLRETLLAYFAADLNAASTAARLGVHQQTVANRLRTIEDRLGRPLMARTLELGMALRLRERIS